MKRIIRIISMSLIGIIMAIACTGCSPKADSLEFDKENIVVEVGSTEIIHYEVFPREDNYKITWSSSDESIAKVVDEYYGYFGQVKGFMTGECVITLEVGGKTDSINVKVVLDPDVDVYPYSPSKFTIYSDLPPKTKIVVSLKGDGFDYTQTIELESWDSWNWEGGKKELTFNDENLEGEYKLTIALPDYEVQPDSVKAIVGENYKYVDFNNELFVRTYTLPYKSDLEIICETPYSQLTEGQRIKISQWLKDKYDLYRKKYNGYWMDDENGVSRPILSVVQEMGAERYNKTYEQMVDIWHYYILGIRN